MSKPIHLGRLAGLEIFTRPSAFVGFTLLCVFLSALVAFAMHIPPLQALIGGCVGTVLHFTSELWHNFGHAIAARRSGYPMKGVVFWGVLATSLYPTNEGKLPGRVHIQRALGGPLASALLAAVAGLLLSILVNPDSAWFWLAAFFFADNLLVFTIGSLLPLGFNDGSTLLAWWRKP